jgi:lipid II isoglutaminyl synthase (glutamine-hydrolysing)
MMKYSLKIGWLYPDLMSTYGDRGNVQVLQKICQWNGIESTIFSIDQDATVDEISKIDIIFGGGSQDLQQEIVMRDLGGAKGEMIRKLIENNIPALFVCGSPQLMGKFYEPAVGKRIQGLGVFDMESIHPGPDKPRCIGNTIAKLNWSSISSTSNHTESIIVGFENHGGRTYLGKNVQPFAEVIHGYGNNGKDKTEGVVYKNAIGCYFHGPLLPKNPEIADILILKALDTKYKATETFKIKPTENILAVEARKTIIKRYQ